MAFGNARGVAQDDKGNLIPAVYVEVRHEASGFPLAVPLYADKEGNVTLDNPFFSATGKFQFYAPGGDYRVKVYKSGYEETFRDVQVGSAQSADINAYASAGFTWGTETQTSAPPSGSCIRFDNEDVSIADHMFVDHLTLGGSDTTNWLSDLQPGDWILLSTGVGLECGWPVLSVTHETGDDDDYFDIELDQTRYAGPEGPISFGDSGFITLAQQKRVLTGGLDTLEDAADDAAAALAGVEVGALYRNGSVLMVRIS